MFKEIRNNIRDGDAWHDLFISLLPEKVFSGVCNKCILNGDKEN
ncbi:MAG: hypothetical protein Q7R95_00020 [bacterium]|nr:hypothetical protein [bacterium]